MGKRRKSTKGGPAAVLGLFGLGMLAAHPLVTLAVIAVGVIAYGLTQLSKRKEVPAKPEQRAPQSSAPSAPRQNAAQNREPFTTTARALSVGASRPESKVSRDELLTVNMGIPSGPTDFSISPSRDSPPDPKQWVPAGQPITVQGFSISCGMVYLNPGRPKEAHAYGDSPGLIFAALPARKPSGLPQDPVQYWPNYRHVEPEVRGSYLMWLRDGRSDPHTPISLVFMYFYGLETRALVDPEGVSDRPAIRAEVQRLLDIYGPGSASFRRYAVGLISWLALDGIDATDLDQLRRLSAANEGTPVDEYAIRLALGYCASRKEPLPAWLAIGWARVGKLGPRSVLIKRSPERYAQIFEQQLERSYPAGFRVVANKTALYLNYQPASRGMFGQVKPHPACEGLPDVLIQVASGRKLALVCEAALAELRKDGKAKAAAPQIDPAVRAAVEALKDRVTSGLVAIPAAELLRSLGEAAAALTPGKWAKKATILESEGIGMEPDIQSGEPPPKADEGAVLFALPVTPEPPRTDMGYRGHKLVVDIGCAVAAGDGKFEPGEMMFIKRHVDAQDLNPSQRARLVARLRWRINHPGTLRSFAKGIAQINQAAREQFARFAIATAQADGNVDAGEVKMIEGIYRMLGLDVARVYTDLHIAQAAPATPAAAPSAGLDHARVAALKAESEQVSAMLSDVFADAPADIAPSPTEEDFEDTDGDLPQHQSVASLPGLDETAAAFLATLLRQPTWPREDAEALAFDLAVMLDGVLEQINEASFEFFDAPLLDGDDPIVIDQELAAQLMDAT